MLFNTVGLALSSTVIPTPKPPLSVPTMACEKALKNVLGLCRKALMSNRAPPDCRANSP